MIILALDPSSTHVGFCIAEDDEYILSGVYSPRGNADQRVRHIVVWVEDKISRYEPNTTVLEEPAANNAHKNAKTDRLLARVGGAIEAVAVLAGSDVDRVWPSQVKATGAHKGARVYAAGIAGKRTVGLDEADAIGVWLAYRLKQQKKLWLDQGEIK